MVGFFPGGIIALPYPQGRFSNPPRWSPGENGHTKKVKAPNKAKKQAWAKGHTLPEKVLPRFHVRAPICGGRIPGSNSKKTGE